MVGFVFLGLFILWIIGFVIEAKLGHFDQGIDITDAWLKDKRDDNGKLN